MKRPNGTGSLFELPDGRWKAAVTIGWLPSGAPRRRTSIQPTLEAAEEALRRFTATFDRTHKSVPRGPVVYVIEAEGLNRIKIGRTRDLAKRLLKMQTDCPVRLKLIAHLEDDGTVEQLLHRRFAAAHVHGEWFEAGKNLRREIVSLFSRLRDGGHSRAPQIAVSPIGTTGFEPATS
jgi:hypothetical protein